MGIYSEKYRRSYESCLKKVQKPARYIGNEFGSVHKKWTDDILSFTLLSRCLRGGNVPFGNENSVSYAQ